MVELRALAREQRRQPWEKVQTGCPLPSEPLNPGLSVEGDEQWFERQ